MQVLRARVLINSCICPSCITVIILLTGAAISIDDASAIGTILSDKQIAFGAECNLCVHRLWFVHGAGPRGGMRWLTTRRLAALRGRCVRRVGRARCAAASGPLDGTGGKAAKATSPEMVANIFHLFGRADINYSMRSIVVQSRR